MTEPAAIETAPVATPSHPRIAGYAALFASWGLPTWFRVSVGLAELTVGLLALRPGSRPVGLLGIGVVMVSAGTMHAALGHSLLIAASLNGSLALAAFATAWALRTEVDGIGGSR